MAGAGLAMAGCGEGTPEPRPADGANLVLVTIDTLRADHLGCYGYAEPTSPVLDRLASTSLVFENAIAQSAVTPVSHASLFTGLNPYRHGLRSLHGGEGYALPNERVTLAELMRANGRTTAGFVSAFPATRHFGLQQGFEVWDEDFRGHSGKGAITKKGVVNTGRAQRRAALTTDRALAWLQEAEEPFFAWIHYFDVHDPVLLPPRRYLAKFPPRSRAKPDRLIAVYDAEIAYVDEQLGRVLGALDQMALADRTVLAVVADHGQGLGDHDWWGHTLLFQEQVRVPFLLSVPGLDGAQRLRSLVRTIDLVPTLVDLMGLECPHGSCDFDGRSLGPLIGGREVQPRVGYSESLNDLAGYYDSPLQNDSLYAVIDGRWKLIARYEGKKPKPSLLFDLEDDPGERVNRIGERPEIARRLRSYLEAPGAIAEARPLAPLDPSTRARLESLGYVQ